MSPTLDEQIAQLKHTIVEMEAQRGSLGDEVVDAALAPLHQKLDELVGLLEVREEQPPAAPAQQRKLVALLFMDVVGSTSKIAGHLDPEDTLEIMDGALKRLARPVEAHGGHVTRFMGDGFKAVFGAPVAREDDPEQAVRAGLDILEVARSLAGELESQWGIRGFQVRLGVNTGLVAIGGLTEAEDTIMGVPVNLAARLESAAPPGGLLISHDTYRHVRGVFDVEPQEPITAKGFDEPVPVYLVQRARPRAFRLPVRGVEGVETRMFGRETELKFLQDALITGIEEGEGQVVTVTGEAGVGKSRLLYEFQEWFDLLPQRVRFFQGRGRQEAQGLPYALLRDLFSFRFRIQEDDSGETSREKIETGFAEVFGEGGEGQMRAHILGQLLGFDFSASPHLKGVLGDAEQLRNRGLMYLGEYFRDLCDRIPVVVFLEDIHWADDSSLDALNYLGERIRRQRLLVVCAARHSLFERRPYWGEGLTYHHRLDLRPLSKRESRQLVGDILKLAEQVPQELRELVVEGAEGNPFYIEELIKMLVEDGVIVTGEGAWRVEPERLAEIEVPSTLAGVLQARLDSLPLEERVVLQQASVVGRLFWDRVVAHLQAAGDGHDDIVSEMLTTLRLRELIYRREESTFADASEFIFKHDILREVTYESVLKRLRRTYHGLVADWLIAHSVERAGEYYGLIAEHLLQAGRSDQAATYFLHAGESALASYANVEAEVHLRKALGLSPDKSLYAAILAGLGDTLSRQGRSDESVQTLRQAIDLYHEMGEYDQVAHLIAHLSWVLWNANDHQKAWQVCQEGLAQLEEVPEGPGMARLLAEAGRTAFFRALGREQVVSLCEQAIGMAQRLGVVEARAEAGITLALLSDNPQESIGILKDIAVLCEERGLLRTAARAHFDIGFFYTTSLGSAERSYHHCLRAAEIYRQIGEIDSMVMALINAGRWWVSLGHLKTWESMAIEFLDKSSATEDQKEECLQRPSAWISYFRGMGDHAIAPFRKELDQMRKGGSYQKIAIINLGLVRSILELDRFIGRDDLTEAEAALLENIQIQWFVKESRFYLAVILARKGLLQEAQDRLADAVQTYAQQLTKQEESHRLEAEIELARVGERWSEVVSICQELIEIYQRGEYRWEWARQLIDLGDALLGRDGPGDHQSAQEVFQQSLEMFTEMGAPGYIQVLEDRLRRSQLDLPPTPPQPTLPSK